MSEKNKYDSSAELPSHERAGNKTIELQEIKGCEYANFSGKELSKILHWFPRDYVARRLLAFNRKTSARKNPFNPYRLYGPNLNYARK